MEKLSLKLEPSKRLLCLYLLVHGLAFLFFWTLMHDELRVACSLLVLVSFLMHCLELKPIYLTGSPKGLEISDETGKPVTVHLTDFTVNAWCLSFRVSYQNQGRRVVILPGDLDAEEFRKARAFFNLYGPVLI